MKKQIASDFLVSLIGHQGPDCVKWPFFCDPQTGYGRVYVPKTEGKKKTIGFAHRVMCELAHGPAPTAAHEVAHSCGRGRFGCVNPTHLAWKTRSENQLDRRRHGTAVTSKHGNRGKLTEADKVEIRGLRGKVTQLELSKRYNVHYETISRIQRTPPRLRKLRRPFTREEVLEIRRAGSEQSAYVIAKRFGSTAYTIYQVLKGKTYRDFYAD